MKIYLLVRATYDCCAKYKVILASESKYSLNIEATKLNSKRKVVSGE